MEDRMKGKAKEAWGALSGDEAKKEEGRAQQRKADAEEEAAQKERTAGPKKRLGRRSESGTGRRSRTRVCSAA